MTTFQDNTRHARSVCRFCGRWLQIDGYRQKCVHTNKHNKSNFLRWDCKKTVKPKWRVWIKQRRITIQVNTSKSKQTYQNKNSDCPNMSMSDRYQGDSRIQKGFKEQCPKKRHDSNRVWVLGGYELEPLPLARKEQGDNVFVLNTDASRPKRKKGFAKVKQKGKPNKDCRKGKSWCFGVCFLGVGFLPTIEWRRRPWWWCCRCRCISECCWMQWIMIGWLAGRFFFVVSSSSSPSRPGKHNNSQTDTQAMRQTVTTLHQGCPHTTVRLFCFQTCRMEQMFPYSIPTNFPQHKNPLIGGWHWNEGKSWLKRKLVSIIVCSRSWLANDFRDRWKRRVGWRKHDRRMNTQSLPKFDHSTLDEH